MKFKFLGTEIYISFLFCATLCFMLAVDRTGLVVPTITAVAVHECGHLLAMWAAECQPKAIRLIPTSVQITRGFSNKKYGESGIALCGPVANLVLFLALYANFLMFESKKILSFAILNLVLAFFNLLPVSGLDGGVLLAAFLSRFTDINKAYRIVQIVTMFFAFFAFLMGVYLALIGTFNISVFIVALYLAVCGMMKR